MVRQGKPFEPRASGVVFPLCPSDDCWCKECVLVLFDNESPEAIKYAKDVYKDHRKRKPESAPESAPQASKRAKEVEALVHDVLQQVLEEYELTAGDIKPAVDVFFAKKIK